MASVDGSGGVRGTGTPPDPDPPSLAGGEDGLDAEDGATSSSVAIGDVGGAEKSDRDAGAEDAVDSDFPLSVSFPMEDERVKAPETKGDPPPLRPPPGSLGSMLAQDDYLTRLERRILRASGGAVQDHRERSFARGAAERLRQYNDSMDEYQHVSQEDDKFEDSEESDSAGVHEEEDDGEGGLLDGSVLRSDSDGVNIARSCCEAMCLVQ
uniref:Uncharacterized protein n=1 Tax=Rhizochromulina marina TaxID=1034831 RepID=A0A7S2RKD9_9STRA